MPDRYCLDANVFIEAKNGPYGFDIVPGFWDWIDDMVEQGIVYSVRPVYDEITVSKDDLAQWVKDRRDSGLFVLPSAAVQANLTSIADYIVATCEPQHAETFVSGADAWVIAQALTDQSLVVTRESLAGPGAKRPKIPNVCVHHNAAYVNTYDMLRQQGASFR